MRVPQPSIGLDPSSSGNHQVSLEAYLEGEAGGGAVGKDTCRKAPESSRPHCKTEVSLPTPPPTTILQGELRPSQMKRSTRSPWPLNRHLISNSKVLPGPHQPAASFYCLGHIMRLLSISASPFARLGRLDVSIHVGSRHLCELKPGTLQHCTN